MLYPLKFKPIFKNYVWGGRNLASLGKVLPAEGIVAESWEVACHKNGSSIVANGIYEGICLPELVKMLGDKLIGSTMHQMDKFPFLVKLIDADHNLSVQVHPDDSFAYTNESGECGKNEMWYIIRAKPGAKIVNGLIPGTTREMLAGAIMENNVECYLNYLEVFPGDVINIPAGMIHSIGEGIILAEIQQNSDITYRIYDYGRISRELHVEKALQVIDFSLADRKKKYSGNEISISNGCSKKITVANRQFCMEVYYINGTITETADGSKFLIFIFIEGNGSILWNSGELRVGAGETVLIPAALGKYSISGNLTALKTYKPNLSIDILQPLKLAGIPDEMIFREIAGLEQADI